MYLKERPKTALEQAVDIAKGYVKAGDTYATAIGKASKSTGVKASELAKELGKRRSTKSQTTNN